MKLNAILRNFGLMLVAVTTQTLLPMSAMAADESIPPADIPPFAMVGDHLISQRHYDVVYRESSRNTFYHGKPPEAEVALIQREVGEKLVTDLLLVQEAKRRNITPDSTKVEKNLAQYERSNAGNPQWLQMRDELLPQLTKQIKEEVLAKQFAEQIKNVGAPTDEQLREYYKDNAELFTQPEQVRVSRIVIAVLPGASQDVWNAAREKLLGLVKRIEEDGADFGELAEKHSDDAASAEKMGDAGYLHGGMLAENAQVLVDKMEVGDISDSFVTTEGVSVVKLTVRNPASLNSFENVKARAADLWIRDTGDKALKDLIAELRAKTRIWVNDARYLPLAAGDQ